VQAAGEGLLAELDTAFASLGLPGYWVIRQLDATSRAAAGWSNAQITRSLAGSVVGAVSDLVGKGVDPDRALWFPDRTAFVSRFLVDLAERRAASRWEYAQFEDLCDDPVLGPARLAAQEPESVNPALLRLSRSEVEVIAAAADVGALLAALAADGAHSEKAVIDALAALSQARRVNGMRGLALTLAAEAARDGGMSIGSVARTAEDVANLLGSCPRQGSDAFLAAVASGDWRTVAQTALSDAYLPMVSWTSDERARLADAVKPATISEDEQCYTPYGGALLLMPIVDDLWPYAESAFRLLCVTAILGRGSSIDVADDPVLRCATGVTADADPLAWLATVTHEIDERADAESCAPDDCIALAAPDTPGRRLVNRCARVSLSALGRRLPGMATASAGYLVRNVLDVGARITFGDGEVLVELDHPPLGVLLSITGLDRDSFTGGDGRRWTLCQQR
jgi:hypothetical protein